MRKPLSEHDATLTSRKRAQPKPDPEAHEALEPVSGGRVRRIVFQEDAPEPAPAQDTWSETWDPEPDTWAPEPARTNHAQSESWPHADPSHRYVPKHAASLEDIHRDIDARILGRRPIASKTVIEEETIYETEKGAVRTSKRTTREGRSRALYIESEKDGKRVERRFNPADVDRIVKRAPEAPEEKPKRRTLFRKKDDAPPSKPKVSKPTKAKASKPTKPKAPKPKATEEVVAAPTKSMPAPSLEASEPYYGYKGKEYPVRDIEGVGPQYTKRLHDLGIETTARLCYENSAILAKKMGIPEKTVKSWQSMSELVKINGVGPQYAEALARAGIEGIQELKSRSASKIAQQVNDYLETLSTSVVGTGITEKRVEGWQAKAKKMRRVRMKTPEN